MRLKLLFAAILIASMSACAPQVLCPAYAVDDNGNDPKPRAQQAPM